MAPVFSSLSLLFLSTFVSQVSAGCDDAPTAAMKSFCQQLQGWDEKIAEAEKKDAAPVLPPGAAGAPPPAAAPNLVPTTIEDCMDINCVCGYLGGMVSGQTCNLPDGNVFRRAVRKEYRVMTDDERSRFHSVLLGLKPTQEFRDMMMVHSQTGGSSSAHSGPGFLPWHREYLKRYELMIRQQDPTLYLPYWDSSLDEALPVPSDSILFSKYFAGSSDTSGNVITGAFAGWQTMKGGTLRRFAGKEGQLFSAATVNMILQQTDLQKILAFTAQERGCPRKIEWNELEILHGPVHMWVGGEMRDIATSSNDPLFFMHHCFVDWIWEQWRQTHQVANGNDNLFCRILKVVKEAILLMMVNALVHSISAAPSCIHSLLCSLWKHFSTPFRNADGLSNAYTDNLYTYAPRPTCPQCGNSDYLFCDRSHGAQRCVAKVRNGGVCQGFNNGEDVCHGGVCQGGRCVELQTTLPPITPAPVVIVNPTVMESCFNEQQCCAFWQANGECSRNMAYMNVWCRASCGFCMPQAYVLRDGDNLKLYLQTESDCTDRHQSCAQWAMRGECQRNSLWMTENCRASCRLCGQTRAQACSGGGQTTAAPIENCDSPGCFNEYECCPIWAHFGECRSNASFMACNCKVSCGLCSPVEYSYGSCNDYHKDCQAWQRIGHCQSHPWMPENCRGSCRNCISSAELLKRCVGGSSQIRNGRKRRAVDEFAGFDTILN